jgi:hypothetical protein
VDPEPGGGDIKDLNDLEIVTVLQTIYKGILREAILPRAGSSLPIV